MTPPYPGFSNRIRRESQEMRREGETAPAGRGPWIEIGARQDGQS